MNKNKIQAYFIDLDGTMLDTGDDNGFMSKKNQDFLLKMQKIKPMIPSTGRRPTGAVPEIMKMINAPYAVCSTGSIVIDSKGEIIHQINIEELTKKHILEYFMENSLYFVINGSGIIYYKDNFNWNMRKWAHRFAKEPYTQIDKDQTIRQFLVFGPDLEGIQKIEAYIKDNFPDLSTHIVSHGYSIEVTHKDATKGKANEFVAQKLGLDIKKCAHVGDSKNDLNALPEIGYLVAMGNAHEDVKKHADFVGVDWKNGGLAKTINDFEQYISNQNEEEK
ncbi:Cof-type HAD-IIB family hydrolase [Mycoplasmopsis mucosicanis]|uniref:Cof-type HAD-IIB family hydrolase n=1 Tax=Mycoplasmopsis mucosicanis TaxID=458208 RepID=A0A507SHP3_9BACT|nr:Cof-type HAD-IIB family hydrolase [Mycoplasmopsis mucosicanis]TQC51290.1 Cof-type HAD-IIB family hydrolase [Mycoplasmopsis mucosicanis]